MKWGLTMNKIVHSGKVTASIAIVGINAALAVATWPISEPTYVTTQDIPTFSFFAKSIEVPKATNSLDFAQEIASIFASLSDGQQPLGAEFEAIWDNNADALYQS